MRRSEIYIALTALCGSVGGWDPHWSRDYGAIQETQHRTELSSVNSGLHVPFSNVARHANEPERQYTNMQLDATFRKNIWNRVNCQRSKKKNRSETHERFKKKLFNCFVLFRPVKKHAPLRDRKGHETCHVSFVLRGPATTDLLWPFCGGPFLPLGALTWKVVELQTQPDMKNNAPPFFGVPS